MDYEKLGSRLERFGEGAENSMEKCRNLDKKMWSFAKRHPVLLLTAVIGSVTILPQLWQSPPKMSVADVEAYCVNWTDRLRGTDEIGHAVSSSISDYSRYHFANCMADHESLSKEVRQQWALKRDKEVQHPEQQRGRAQSDGDDGEAR